MTLHIIIHADFEKSRFIASWGRSKGLEVTEILRHRGELLPPLSEVDALVVLGGPMSTYDPLPWIQEETTYLQEALRGGKKIFGICLGSQLLAEALGEKVFPGNTKEIGWYDLHVSPETLELFPFLPEPWTVFHWHGDTYRLPAGTLPFGFTELTACQGFLLPPQVAALQFHPEVEAAEVAGFIEAGKYGQPLPEPFPGTITGNQALLGKILDSWLSGLPGKVLCPRCSALAAPLHLENPLDAEEPTQEFPDQFLNLLCPHPDILRYYRNTERRLLKCPDCGKMYLYTQKPSDRKDWVREALYPLTLKTSEQELDRAEDEAGDLAEKYGTTYRENLPAILAALTSVREGLTGK